MSLLATDDSMHESPRSGWLRVLLVGVAMSQLFAFWLLCSHQVRRAEARRDEAAIQQMALTDCLQYIPGSTIASCSRIETNAQGPQPADEQDAPATGAVPVSFSYR